MTEPLPVAHEVAEIDAIVARMEAYFIAGTMFHNAYHDLVIEGYGTHDHAFMLSGITSNSETEQVARDRAYSSRCEKLLECHVRFRALRRRYADIGITGKFLNRGEYHGAWNTFEFFVGKEHLPELERMAQDEVGLQTDEERERAAKNFRTYFVQRYGEDSERYRRELPLVERSPYRLFGDPA